MPVPAQKTLVERFISWRRVEERLRRYPAIGRAFPLGLLNRHREAPPYFCHYMSWRLGTWIDESIFQRLDELLRLAESLPNWEAERSLLESAEFADFWALVWQLQMAEYLCSVGTDVQWSRDGGPDLSVQVEGAQLYVECFVYRKSFGIELFLQDVLTRLVPDLKFDHAYCLPFALPQNQNTSDFLNETIRPFLDPEQVARWREETRRRWPVRVAAPASTLVMYLNGDDDDLYDPKIIPSPTGEPSDHIEVILSEAVTAKTGKNKLSERHPNLIAVSYLLSNDAHLAFSMHNITTPPDLGTELDALAISLAGITDILSREKLALVASKEAGREVIERIARPVSGQASERRRA